MGVVVVDLVTTSTKVRPKVQGRFNTLVKPHATILRRLERATLDKLRAILCIHSRGEDEGAIFRLVRGGLPMSGSADGVANIT
jgi:hypothetical protein